MSSLWPTRRHDIKIARLFIKKHSPTALEDLDPKTLTPEQQLSHLYPWVPALIRRFRKEHNDRDWMVCMLKAIDAVIKPHFKNQQQAVQISQGIVACIRLHVGKMELQQSYDRPDDVEAEFADADSQLEEAISH